MRPNPLWISARQIARWKTLSRGLPARALIADLRDPLLAPLLELAPTKRDLADAQKPLAGPRGYFLKRRALLRHFAGLWIGCAAEDVVIAHDADGAPRVLAPDANVFVSVSARGAYAGLAVSDRPVGIDIELAAPPREPVWDALHRGERAEIEADWRESGRDARFIDVWLAKEAYLKALGTGLKRDPSGISILFDGGEFRVADDARPGEAPMGLRDGKIIGGDFVICACVSLPPRQPIISRR